jgi:hypothetical protein
MVCLESRAAEEIAGISRASSFYLTNQYKQYKPETNIHGGGLLTMSWSLKASRRDFSNTRWAARSAGVKLRTRFFVFLLPSTIVGHRGFAVLAAWLGEVSICVCGMGCEAMALLKSKFELSCLSVQSEIRKRDG